LFEVRFGGSSEGRAIEDEKGPSWRSLDWEEGKGGAFSAADAVDTTFSALADGEVMMSIACSPMLFSFSVVDGSSVVS
jgi:hypothetical protein